MKTDLAYSSSPLLDLARLFPCAQLPNDFPLIILYCTGSGQRAPELWL